MSKFNAPQKTENGNNIPNMPSVCMVGDCTEETTIGFVTVINEKGIRLTGCASDYGFKRNGIFNLKDNFKFIRWITRCSKCHYTDLLAAQKVYFKNRWCERVIQKEVKDMTLNPDQAKKYLDTLGSKIL